MVHGSCLCGGIRFEYARAVSEIYLCHCSLCRKNSGAASNAVVVVPEDTFNWLSGDELRQVYTKPTGWSATFCRTCGSPVPARMRGATAYGVPAGLLDDDPGARIGCHILVGSKAPWDEIGGSAPQFLEGLRTPKAGK
ncbi:MAG TPA: GFA family protein [Myxococcota bacterium]|nr:GFA family protein [Myxococcota bacterium]